jgi:type II secretory pathway predicted ATPase ExeA/outer membrane protein OmpA-like peptidoglycan-associated protein
MYLSSYHLNEEPFQNSGDSKFIWFGEKYTEALAILKYSLQENKGFVLLTGDKGVGKTLMVDTFLKSIDDRVVAAMIPDPVTNYTEFAKILSHKLKMSRNFSSKGEFLIQFKSFLQETYAKNKKVLLIVDEVQKFSDDLLEDIRLLSNAGMACAELVSIFFVGRNEFVKILTKDSNKALRQRISIIYNIDPLNVLETRKYVNHRLRAAGSVKEIFSPGAINKIHLFSAGAPGMINTICDRAMQISHAAGLSTIDPKLIVNCVKELQQSKILAFDEHQIRPHWEKCEQPLFPKIKDLNWGKLNLAASLVSGIIIGSFWIHHSYLNLSQPIPTAKKADRNLNSSEKSIDPGQKNPSLDVMNPKAAFADQQKFDKEASEPVSNDIALPQTFRFFFQNNSKRLSPKDLVILNRLVNLIKRLPNCVIIIEGYTDSTGNYWHNKKLSKARADIVKHHLTRHGIDDARIQTFGMGTEKPIASNQTEAGRKMNRRVEIKLIVASREVILSQR